MFVDRDVANKVASNAFRLDKVYSRRHGLSRCPILTADNKGRVMGIVKAHAEKFCDVAFEFEILKNGSKLRCVGLGRPEVVRLYYR